MAYTTIDDPSQHFDILTRSGVYDSSGTYDLTGLNFKPDFVWEKVRSVSGDHYLQNSSLTGKKMLKSNSSAAENTDGNIESYLSNGIQINRQYDWNSSRTLVDWFWKANGGTTSSNSDGDITATVQANTTAGFSIMTWTSNNADNQTIGHDLGAAPEVFWVKIRDATGSWYCYFKEAGATHYLRLNSSDARVDNVIWGDTHPTSSVITVDTNSLSGSTPTVVSYAFKQIKGYSKFGKFRGNANADGAFIYTGFKPAWLMIKNIGASGTGYHWYIWDNKRDTINVMDNTLHADENNAENTFDQDIDFVSNGFKLRGSGVGMNPNSHDAIYMAFAEHPFVSSKGVPVTAR